MAEELCSVNKDLWPLSELLPVELIRNYNGVNIQIQNFKGVNVFKHKPSELSKLQKQVCNSEEIL